MRNDGKEGIFYQKSFSLKLLILSCWMPRPNQSWACQKRKLTQRSNEFNGNQWTEISWAVDIRIKERWESSCWVILDVVQNFWVGSVLATTWHPNLVSLALRQFFDVEFQVLWHIVGKVIGVIVILWHPTVNSIELQENAWCWVVVPVSVRRGALIEFTDVQFAHLTSGGLVFKVTVFLIAWTQTVFWNWQNHFSCGKERHFSNQTLHKSVQYFRPINNLRLIWCVVPNQRSLINFRRNRSEAEAGTDTDERFSKLPLWGFIVNSHQQSLHADCKQSRQCDVKDGIEGDEFSCKSQYWCSPIWIRFNIIMKPWFEAASSRFNVRSKRVMEFDLARWKMIFHITKRKQIQIPSASLGP